MGSLYEGDSTAISGCVGFPLSQSIYKCKNHLIASCKRRSPDQNVRDLDANPDLKGIHVFATLFRPFQIQSSESAEEMMVWTSPSASPLSLDFTNHSENLATAIFAFATSSRSATRSSSSSQSSSSSERRIHSEISVRSRFPGFASPR